MNRDPGRTPGRNGGSFHVRSVIAHLLSDDSRFTPELYRWYAVFQVSDVGTRLETNRRPGVE